MKQFFLLCTVCTLTSFSLTAGDQYSFFSTPPTPHAPTTQHTPMPPVMPTIPAGAPHQPYNLIKLTPKEAICVISGACITALIFTLYDRYIRKTPAINIDGSFVKAIQEIIEKKSEPQQNGAPLSAQPTSRQRQLPAGTLPKNVGFNQTDQQQSNSHPNMFIPQEPQARNTLSPAQEQQIMNQIRGKDTSEVSQQYPPNPVNSSIKKKVSATTIPAQQAQQFLHQYGQPDDGESTIVNE